MDSSSAPQHGLGAWGGPSATEGRHSPTRRLEVRPASGSAGPAAAQVGPAEAGSAARAALQVGRRPGDKAPPPSWTSGVVVGGQGLWATGRGGPHSNRRGESDLQSRGVQGLLAWLPVQLSSLHIESPGSLTSHSWVHLPRPVTWCRSELLWGMARRQEQPQGRGVGGRGSTLQEMEESSLGPSPLCRGPACCLPTLLTGGWDSQRGRGLCCPPAPSS